MIVQQVEDNKGYKTYRRLCTTCDPTTSAGGQHAARCCGGKVLCKSIRDGSSRLVIEDHEVRIENGSCHRVRGGDGSALQERSRKHSKTLAIGSRSRGSDIWQAGGEDCELTSVPAALPVQFRSKQRRNSNDEPMAIDGGVTSLTGKNSKG